MNYFIITGTSRGIGDALARKMLQGENTLFCVSRGPNRALAEEARRTGSAMHYFEADLGRTDGLEDLMNDIFSRIDLWKASSLALVNNAGVLDPVGPLHTCDSDMLLNNLIVNLAVPMLLCSMFVQRAAGLDIPKKIVNISSGAARKPYRGWGAYCTAKAGLDHLTRCLALEQQFEKYPVTVISFTPGVVETAMQGVIRNASPDVFPDRERFIRYAEEGKLLDPGKVAGVIAGLLADDGLPQGLQLDIRTMAGDRDTGP